MRLFAGIFPAPDTLEEIWKVQEKLREAMKEGVRWVRKERLHITLRFYGDDADLERTREHFLTAVDEAPSFSVRLVEISGFPSPRSARVIFLAPEYHRELFELASRFEGVSPEQVTPHLTLGRLMKRRAVPAIPFDPIPFEVREVVLVHSILGGANPHYEIVETKPLAEVRTPDQSSR